jgi:type II secretory pathway component PulF
MPGFTYKALGPGGAVQNGKLDAADRAEALRLLDRKGLQPVTIQQAGGTAVAEPKSRKTRSGPSRHAAKAARADKPGKAEASQADADGLIRLKQAEVVLFTEELADMLGAGLQLEPALRAMEGRQELGSLKEIAERIRHMVRDGTNFSVALRRTSPSFGPLYCSLAAAGEASGALHTILSRQAHYLKTLSELRSRLILAMIYPAFLILAVVGVIVIFVTILIPQLTQLIETTSGGKLPGPIVLLVATTDHFAEFWYVYVVLLLAAAFFFKAWKDNEANRPTWDRMKLQMPLVGRVIASRFYVQFLETMANLVGNGLTLLRALELSRDATQNQSLRSALDGIIEEVGDGRSLSKAMIRDGTFPPLLIDMVAVGEQTGKIDQSLRRAAERYDKELNNDLSRIMALIMPVILIAMALVIGSVVYLMISAIFQTISNLNSR